MAATRERERPLLTTPALIQVGNMQPGERIIFLETQTGMVPKSIVQSGGKKDNGKKKSTITFSYLAFPLRFGGVSTLNAAQGLATTLPGTVLERQNL